jgi:hypothetical protein
MNVPTDRECLERACPTCGARPGQHCQRRTAGNRPATRFHAARRAPGQRVLYAVVHGGSFAIYEARNPEDALLAAARDEFTVRPATQEELELYGRHGDQRVPRNNQEDPQ